MVVADPDMLRQVMVKEFSSFQNRMVSLRTCVSNTSFVDLTLMDVFCLLALYAEFALHHQAHERLSAHVEEWTLEESEEHPDSGIQRFQDEGGQTQISLLSRCS